MFSEFWASIAIMAVKDLLVKPQISQLMADLLDKTVPELLISTQTYTLPWLVLTRKIDVIKRISQARKDEDLWITCLTFPNIAPIVSLLLTQDVADTEAFVMSHLKSVSPRFEMLDTGKPLEFTDLIGIKPADYALQLLKIAGEADGAKKQKVSSPCLYKPLTNGLEGPSRASVSG